MMINVKNKIIIAVLAALFIPLSYFSITIPVFNLKLTLQNLPIYIGAIMYGPLAGGLIAFLGQFFSQILQYGLEPMTIIWVLPQVILGLLTGLIIYNKNIGLRSKGFLVAIIFLNLLVTVLNTICSYLDAYIKEYNIYATTATIIPKFVVSIIVAIVFAIIIPYIIKAIKKLG